jgi:hypothetical protein
LETYVCVNCDVEFQDQPSRAKRRKHQYCSRECYDIYRTKTLEKTCVTCGNTWTAVGAATPRGKRLTCSDACLEVYLVKTRFKPGNIPHNFKGYRISTQGYFMVQRPVHPLADKSGYVKRANIVMEMKMGRCLDRGEVVHHIDRNKLNDDPSNLMLFSSNSAHISFHYYSGDCGIQGAYRNHLEAE